MNFHNGKDYSYAILGNEDGLVFAKHREHHRTNNQERYIYQSYLNNIAIQFGMVTGFHHSLVNLVSAIYQGHTNMIKSKQAKANIAVLNVLGIPRSYSLASNTISIICASRRTSRLIRKVKPPVLFLEIAYMFSVW